MINDSSENNILMPEDDVSSSINGLSESQNPVETTNITENFENLQDNLSLIPIDTNNTEFLKKDNNPDTGKIYDTKFITSKIEDYEKKLKEQQTIQKKILDQGDSNLFVDSQELETNITVNDTLVEYSKLIKKIEILHKDIKICELYKKNLENEVREYNKNIRETRDLRKNIFKLKSDIIELKKQRDLLNLEIITLEDKKKKVLLLSTEVENKFTGLLDLYRQSVEKNDGAEKFRESIGLEIDHLNNIKNSIFDDIDKSKRELELLLKRINDLDSQKFNLEKLIQNEIDRRKSELEKDLQELD